MSYSLYKILSYLVTPAVLLAGGVLLAVFFLYRNKFVLARKILLIVFAFYYLLSITPSSDFLKAVLLNKEIVEERAEENFSNVDAIVILSGGISLEPHMGKKGQLSRESMKRSFFGLEKYFTLQNKTPIIFAGGVGNPYKKIEDIPGIVRDFFVTMGVSEEDIWVEYKSRTTYESAMEVKEMLQARLPHQKKHKILLFTSPIHYPRSVAVFAKNCCSVISHSSVDRWQGKTYSVVDFIPEAAMFDYTTRILHEWLGIVYYKMTNKI